MNDKAALSKFVCQQNIERYQRLLRTELTELERDFVKKRLGEEKQALQLAKAQTPSTVVENALKNAYPVAKVIVIAFLSNLCEFLLPSFDLVEQVGLI